MEYVLFCVDRRPFAYWDWDLAARNLMFLRGIDPEYYNYVVAANGPYLEDENRLQAAAAIRIAYSQALETLFGLLCAGVQAPKCQVGWMQSYRTEELRRVVQGISSDSPPFVHPAFQPASWPAIAAHVHSCLPWDKDKNAWIGHGFGRLWSRLAAEFLDERGSQEYNALKHGTRARLGGFEMRVGLQPAKGVAPPHEAIFSLGGSQFGSTFFSAERIGGNKVNVRPRSISRNWDPKGMAQALGLIAMSIQNIAGFFRIVNGDRPEECGFSAPLHESDFDLPWANPCGVISSDMDTLVGIDDITPFTKDEILEKVQELATSFRDIPSSPAEHPAGPAGSERNEPHSNHGVSSEN